ncbi:hypothetical protein DFH27DRAFT_78407 [Peziza echinospora]|nr:hypothetical protein DFH27DRAFT_78407 [Peziza echinospora]
MNEKNHGCTKNSSTGELENSCRKKERLGEKNYPQAEPRCSISRRWWALCTRRWTSGALLCSQRCLFFLTPSLARTLSRQDARQASVEASESKHGERRALRWAGQLNWLHRARWRRSGGGGGEGQLPRWWLARCLSVCQSGCGCVCPGFRPRTRVDGAGGRRELFWRGCDASAVLMRGGSYRREFRIRAEPTPWNSRLCLGNGAYILYNCGTSWPQQDDDDTPFTRRFPLPPRPRLRRQGL